MPDMLATGAAFLASQQRLHTSRTAIYERVRDGVPTLRVAELHVMVGTSLFEQMANNASIFTVQSADWIVDVESLVWDDSGEPFVPAKGDFIIDEAVPGKRLTYEVRTPTADEPWRYADRHRKQVRIHSALKRTDST